ncbi:MAG: hypothetical protein H8E71_00470 [Candidatus Marinimicrobia bacterium]|nr:hypothetical protein [Candidatus Neomarinimicrobiota bacterium]
MFRVKILWIILGAFLLSQNSNTDYPDWFLNPPQGEYTVGLSKNVSKKSVSKKEAYLDALVINEMYHNGAIMTNMIASRSKLADSLGLSLGSQIMLPDGVTLIRQHTIGDLYCALFSFDYGKESVKRKQMKIGKDRIKAIGKQTIHPDRIFESWASAEIEAFKELSMIKISKIQSITKKSGKKLESLIYLRSSSKFSNAKIVRRWIKNNVAHVEVSDSY